MAFQLSPGINVSEIDLTTIVPSVATSIGGIAGNFNWGPVNEVVTVSDEVTLVDRFGKPDSTNYEYWFSTANFLAYSNNLKIVRAVDTATTLNASANGTGVLIENESEGQWDGDKLYERDKVIERLKKGPKYIKDYIKKLPHIKVQNEEGDVKIATRIPQTIHQFLFGNF